MKLLPFLLSATLLVVCAAADDGLRGVTKDGNRHLVVAGVTQQTCLDRCAQSCDPRNDNRVKFGYVSRGSPMSFVVPGTDDVAKGLTLAVIPAVTGSFPGYAIKVNGIIVVSVKTNNYPNGKIVYEGGAWPYGPAMGAVVDGDHRIGGLRGDGGTVQEMKVASGDEIIIEGATSDAFHVAVWPVYDME